MLLPATAPHDNCGLAHMAPAPLDYVAVPESFKLPAHAIFGGTSGVAFNS
jgi:hypothetical protein